MENPIDNDDFRVAEIIVDGPRSTIRNIVRVGESSLEKKNLSISLSLKSAFLPVGYPASVREGYLEYQIWDLIQGLTSYLRSNLAIKEILSGLGVGDVAATASAGALGWIMLSGASMIGGLLFAWLCAPAFCKNVRQWRLFADVINDVGLTLNMLAPLAGKRYFLIVAGAGSVCTSMCGVAAGATKAAISQFFAKGDNIADLHAKESSQETAVNLIGLVGGYAFLSLLSSESPVVIWTAFAFLTVLHIVANVRAVRTLRFDVVNESRFKILHAAWRHQHDMSVASVGDAEQLLPSAGFAQQNVVLGASVSSASAKDADGIRRALLEAQKLNRKFAIAPLGDDRVGVYLTLAASSRDILRARFCAEEVSSEDDGEAFVAMLEKQGWDTSRHLFAVGATKIDWHVRKRD